MLTDVMKRHFWKELQELRSSHKFPAVQDGRPLHEHLEALNKWRDEACEHATESIATTCSRIPPFRRKDGTVPDKLGDLIKSKRLEEELDDNFLAWFADVRPEAERLKREKVEAAENRRLNAIREAAGCDGELRPTKRPRSKPELSDEQKAPELSDEQKADEEMKAKMIVAWVLQRFHTKTGKSKSKLLESMLRTQKLQEGTLPDDELPELTVEEMLYDLLDGSAEAGVPDNSASAGSSSSTTPAPEDDWRPRSLGSVESVVMLPPSGSASRLRSLAYDAVKDMHMLLEGAQYRSESRNS